MGTRYWMMDSSGDELVFTLFGKHLVTGEGENRLVQGFPTAAAAREHLERVANLRQREGYLHTRNAEVADESVKSLREPPFDGEVDCVEGAWTATFKGDAKVPVSVCRRLVERVERDAPRRIQLICDFSYPGTAWERALDARSLPSVKAFIFDTYFQTQTRQYANSIGDLAAVLKACPSLERFFATGSLALSAVCHTSLRALHLIGAPLAAQLAKALGSCELPVLERLAISLCSDDGPGPDLAVVAALRALRADRLTEVHVEGVEDVPRFLSEIASAGLPASWKALTLDGGCGGDEEQLLAVMTRHSGALGSLSALGLPLGDELSSEADDRARAIVPTVRDSQEWRDAFLPATYQDW